MYRTEWKHPFNARFKERNEKIIKLWRQNKTSTEIAAEMSMTRSAVMGVVGRYGERKTPRTSANRLHKSKVIEVANIYNPRKSVRKKVMIKKEKEAVVKKKKYVRKKGKNLMELNHFDCRWIFDDNLYCAQPILHGSYCKHHCAIVYVPNVKKEKPRQAET